MSGVSLQRKGFIAASILLPVLLAACSGGGGGGGGSSVGSVVARYAYAPSFSDNTVSMYAVDADSGELRYNGYVPAGTSPHSAAVHPSGRFVYVTNFGNTSGSSLSAYRVRSDGRLTPFDSGVGCNNCGARGLSIDPMGNYLYVAYDTLGRVEAYRVDSTDGTLTGIGGVSVPRAFAVTLDPAGRFAYATSFSGGSVAGFRVGMDGALNPMDTDAASTGVQPTISAQAGAHNLAIDPTGKFAYVTNYIAGSVSVYQVNASTGALSPMGAAPAGSGARGVAVDPSGQYLFVTNHLANTVSVFAINRSSGVLTGHGTVSESVPTHVSFDPGGRHVYVSCSGASVTARYDLDAASGDLTSRQDTVGRPDNQELVFLTGTTPVRAAARAAYVVNRNSGSLAAFAVGAATGNLSLLGGAAQPTGAYGSRAVAVDPLRRFAYVVNQTSGTISRFTLDDQGALSTLAGAPVTSAGSGPRHIVVEPSGRFLYVANYDSGTIAAFAIDQNNGALTAVTGSPFAAGGNPFVLGVHPAGRFLYVGNSNSGNLAVFSINTQTGALTAIPGGAANVGWITGFVADPAGRTLYASFYGTINYGTGGVAAYAINPQTGGLTPLVPGRFWSSLWSSNVFGFGTGSNSVSMDPSGGFVYVANELSLDPNVNNSYAVFTRNRSTGVLTTAGSSPYVAAGVSPHSVFVEPGGKFVYTANENSDDIAVYAIQPDGSLVSRGLTSSAGSGPRFVTVTGAYE